MFLVFAGDYSALISTIFGKATDGNVTDAPKGPPEVNPKKPHDDISVLSKKNADKDNGKSGMWRRGVKRDVQFLREDMSKNKAI